MPADRRARLSILTVFCLLVATYTCPKHKRRSRYLPLVTGDSERADGIRFFRNEPDVERVVHMVTRKSKELGATHLTDLYSWSDSVWGSFSLIFWYRWTSVSANASMAPQAPPAPTIN